MKKILSLLSLVIILVFTSCSNSSIKNMSSTSVVGNNETRNYTVLTTTDLPNLVLNGQSYLDENTIFYYNYNNVNHYDGWLLTEKEVNSLIEFDVIFDNFDIPTAYFSFTLRASDVNSILSPLVTQNGYSFVLHPNGEFQVYKNYEQVTWKYDFPKIEENIKYRFKIGAIEENNSIRLLYYINDELVYEYVDNNNPLVSGGNCFNICSLVGDRNGVIARVISTKEVIIPSYKTYTVSTLNVYPIRSGEVEADRYNNLNFSTGFDTAGFSLNEQNYSFEFNINFSSFPNQTAFYVALRSKYYARANSSDIGGYSFGIGNNLIYVFKVGDKMLNQISYQFEENEDYQIEVGAVDINENKTLIFININGLPVFSTYDESGPYQEPGYLLMTNEGDIISYVSSSFTSIVPLKTKVEENENYTSYTIYFNQIFTISDMIYADFIEQNLKSIFIDGISVYNFNNTYKANTGLAVNLSASKNKLTIDIANELLTLNGESVNRKFNYIKIKRSSKDNGLKAPSRKTLKHSYFYYF